MSVNDTLYSFIVYFLLFFAGCDDCLETFFCLVFTHYPLPYVKSEQDRRRDYPASRKPQILRLDHYFRRSAR